MILDRFTFYRQLDAMDCGAACLRMVARHHGRFYALEYLRELTYLERDGVSLMGISDAAERLGLHTLAAKVVFSRLTAGDLPTPMIAYWRQRHYVVVYRVSKKYVWVADPAEGKFKLTHAAFREGWVSDSVEGEDAGIILLLEPTPTFFERDGVQTDKGGFRFLWTYMRSYRGLIVQVALGLFMASLVQLVFPFLTQAIVDVGINNQDVPFIYLVLLAQLALFLGRIVIEFIRGWIMLHIGTRINIRLISDFLLKMMKLPIRFFDTKLTGDLLQRINDNHRVEQFLTSATFVTFFSLFNFVIFGAVLAFYFWPVFVVFLVSTVLYLAWILFFLRRRRELDYKRFDQMAENQSSLMQLIHGIKDIKLHNAEKQKRWEWERIQARLYRLSLQYLALDQYQRGGAAFFNEFKNIVITFISAKAVVDGHISLGMMLAIQYIIGQLNAPLEQLVGFILMAQDAKISLERMNEIHNKEDEERPEERMNTLPEGRDLTLEMVNFRYSGPYSSLILDEIDLRIPHGGTTAIVGASGSGKTTLLKLLLGFYAPTEGAVRLGGVSLQNIQGRIWRDRCGVVMQDGFIFTDTIARNIALGDDVVDKKRLYEAVKVANIQQFIESLPLGYNTRIGEDGIGLSQGQKQRILIARAVYKHPDYLFFDEATNALDAYNELVIMENLETFLRGRTVVIVAHRLSTVRHADQIIVLERGEIIERGTHEQLTEKRGAYYHLVKNQLELGA